MTPEAALPLLVISLGAMVSPRLAARVGVPVAVVEIILGVGMGALGLGDGGPFLRFLADLGFAFFLFIAGLETDLSLLRADRRRALAAPVAPLVSVLLAFGWSAWRGWDPWVALALSATAVPLLLAVVRELGLVRAPVGMSMLTAGAVGEIVTVALISVAELTTHAQGLGQTLWGVARLLWMVAGVVWGGAAIRLLWWWYPGFFRQLIAGGDAAELGVRVGFGLMFTMIGVAMLAGVEPVLGAFFAGLAFGQVVRSGSGLEEKLGAMGYGFFVPVFFTHVGMRLDLSLDVIQAHGAFILEVVLVMWVVKLIPQLAGVVTGRTMREAVATAALLAAPLTLLIATADLGARSGAIDPATETALVVAGMLASLIYPSVGRRLLA